VKTAYPDDDLFDWFKYMANSAALLVVQREKHERPIGIVTNYDALMLVREIAQDFMWTDEVETHLRQIVARALAREVSELVPRRGRGANRDPFEYLRNNAYMSDLVRIITDFCPGRFQGLLSSVKSDDLKELTKIRNEVCHFRGPLKAAHRRTLKRVRDRLFAANKSQLIRK